MSFLLDTNTCIYLLKGHHPELAKRISAISAKDVSTSSIVWFELMFGAAKSKQRAEVEARLRTFAGQVEILSFDSAAAEAAGEVRAALEKGGTPIGPFDTLIAGHALALKATLVTHNLREFKRVRGLSSVDWTTGGSA